VLSRRPGRTGRRLHDRGPGAFPGQFHGSRIPPGAGRDPGSGGNCRLARPCTARPRRREDRHMPHLGMLVLSRPPGRRQRKAAMSTPAPARRPGHVHREAAGAS
jgi:hypothetical protein